MRKARLAFTIMTLIIALSGLAKSAQAQDQQKDTGAEKRGRIGQRRIASTFPFNELDDGKKLNTRRLHGGSNGRTTKRNQDWHPSPRRHC